MKREKRHLHRQAEEHAGKYQPCETACDRVRFRQRRKLSKVECTADEVNSEEGKQHRDTPDKGVDEEFGRGVLAILGAEYFDEEKPRHETHLEEEEPEDEVLRGKGAVERRLHQQHEGEKDPAATFSSECEREHQRG